MHRLGLVEDKGGVPPDIPVNFDAAVFFSMLRAAGAKPLIRHGGLYLSVCRSVSGVEQWASMNDPTGELRFEYVRLVWESRRPGTDIVYLG